jgi:hypothetical protein
MPQNKQDQAKEFGFRIQIRKKVVLRRTTKNFRENAFTNLWKTHITIPVFRTIGEDTAHGTSGGII